jgi:predicted RNase H-like nuclease
MDIHVLGVDGCRNGWLACRYEIRARSVTFHVYPDFAEILRSHHDAKYIAVDIPIGLGNDGLARRCDAEARRLLAGPRSSSVFPAPPRCLLEEADYVAACAKSRRLFGKGISKQSHAIYPKIAEVDRVMAPEIQDWVLEVHPEICFWGIARRAMCHSKKTSEGYDERRILLERALGCQFPDRPHWRLMTAARGAQPDDMLDAAVAALTAYRAILGNTERLPDRPDIDEAGLRMEIIY